MFRSAEKSPGVGRDSANEMAKVESGREYVLQWTGHAAHVTERFSGLLARQALVDVTLICQGQKLRVHKLVLASSSLYFEEMLEQDLGQEPIILLRDLDFEVLKAMVEFMYCGETTVSQRHLQTLLDAAQVFKVKELKRIVETMIKSKLSADKVSSDGEARFPSSCTTGAKKSSGKARPSGERCDEKSLPRDLEESEILETKMDRTLDNNARSSYTDEDNSLYEIVERAEEQPRGLNEIEESDKSSPDTLDGASLKISSSEESARKEGSTDNFKFSSLNEDDPINSICNEARCCKFVNGAELREDSSRERTTRSRSASREASIGECSRVYTPKKRKLLESDDRTAEVASGMPIFPEEAKTSTSSPKPDERATEKNLKVYTHKRRKSMDEKRSQIFDNVCDSREETSPSTSSIDLNDESSSNETPIDVSAVSLDMETSEYIWSLSTETIQSVVGCTINPTNFSATPIPETEKIGATRDDPDRVVPPDTETSVETKESFSCANGHADISETPILRRSVRINQLESDDSLNNNTGVTNVRKGRERSLDPEIDDHASKSKRRVNRDNGFRVTDENVAETRSLEKSGNSRSLRSATKLSSRTSKITRGVVTGRDEKTKSARQARDKPERSSDSTDILVNTRLNTIASVDRALWGDMADVLENHRDSREELSNYATSREIPFAVGLLPLRAALERMQATVDHQPRKTRSSVAPWRQEATTIQRRKFYECDSSHGKHLDSENVETAVCHIEIRTSPNRDGTHGPRISTDEQIIAVGTSAESNEQ